MIRVSLDLSKHCIQTETRRQYNRLLSMLLKSDGGEDAEEQKLELLRQALESWDFPALRAEYKELAGGEAHDVVLVGDDRGRCRLMLDGRTIAA